MSRGSLIAGAIAAALVAAGSGALALGLEAPALGAGAAVAGVVAAALASTGLGSTAAAGGHGSNDDPARVTRWKPEAIDEPEPAADDEGLVDPVTGLLDHRYFVVALDRRVAASRRKLAPLSLVLLELRPDDPSHGRVSDQSLKVLAAVVRAVLRESDTGCRLDGHTLALILEDTPESGSVWATERVRAGFFATTFRGAVRLAAGVAAYPAHALEADRLLAAARAALERSRQAGDESIEIADADDTAEPAGGESAN